MDSSNVPQGLAQPNTEQQAVLDMFQKYAEACYGHRHDLRAPVPTPIKILILGGPGVGKTFFINKAIQIASSFQFRLVTSAFMGSAAALLDEGRTVHNLFSIPFGFSSIEPLPRDKQVMCARRFADAIGIVLDEISMCNSTLLGAVDHRARQIMGRDEAFGGLGVFLVGDFL